MTAMLHVVGALLRRVQRERDRDQVADLVDGARARGAPKRFEFREGQLDRVEVGTVRGQKPQRRPGRFNGGAAGRVLMHGEVVEHDHIPGPQRRDEDLIDIGTKRERVHRAVEHGRRLKPLQTQGGHHRVRLPVPVRRVIMEPRAAQTAAEPAQEVRGLKPMGEVNS